MDDMTIGELQERMSSGELSARQITTFYLERIERLDRRGPQLNSVIELNPEALTIAEALDDERAAQGARGPLHGIPILVKDNITTPSLTARIQPVR